MKNSTGIRLLLLLSLAVVITACGDSSVSYVITEVTEDGIPGVLKILAVGGTGVDYGGTGNQVQVIGSAISSDVKVMKTGKVNAAATIPLLQPDHGPYPRIVEGTDVIEYFDYMGGGNNQLRASPPYDAFIATGLWIKPGGVLILEPQVDTDGNGSTYERVDVYFSYSVYIEGTLLPSRKDAFTNGDNSTTHTADLLLYTSNVVVAAGGVVQSGGIDVMAGYGGNGGTIDIEADGMIVNGGLIRTAGGDGQGGAPAGDLLLYSYSYGSYSSGTLDASGGTGLTEGGGDGGMIEVEGYRGPSFVTGTVDASGGDGEDYGGWGGYVLFQTTVLGAVAFSGTADSSGGNCTGIGDGGTAGDIEFDAWNGSIRISGTVNAKAGNASNDANGGNGGNVRITGNHNFEQIFNEIIAPRGVFVGGNIDTTGGFGRWGGSAGQVFIHNQVYADIMGSQGVTVPTTAPVMLVGYELIDASGGPGQDGGGSAGTNHQVLNQNIGVNGNGFDGEAYPIYSVLNEVAWRAVGGDSEFGGAGPGGSLWLYRYIDWTSGTPWDPENEVYVRNTGSIDLSGGEGPNSNGGNAGSFTLGDGSASLATGDVLTHENTGAIKVNGGDGYYAGSAGTIDIVAADTGSVINSGDLSALGGNGGYYGSSGGTVYIQSGFWNGGSVSNSGDIDVRGGNSDLSFGYGYNGGTIYVRGSHSVTVTGTLDLGGGNGGYGGSSGGSLYLLANRHVSFDGTVNAEGGLGGGDGSQPGGYVNIQTNDDGGSMGNYDPGAEQSVSITGSISVDGGYDEYTVNGSGFNGGTVDIFSHGDVSLDGTIDANSGTDYYGSYGGTVDIYSDATITSTCVISANGGDGEWSTNGGGTVNLQARHVNQTGDVSAIGGDCLINGAGNGGSIQIHSTEGGSILDGTMNVSPGTGFPDGSNGSLWVDGIFSGDPVVNF